MKLNMGCGYNKQEGYVNVDASPECQPDMVCDLESLPWPWPDDSVDEVLFNHSLEHLGQDTRVFLGMIKELYRVCKDQATITINAPHPRHNNFINDPTHVRVITTEMWGLFDREVNDRLKAEGRSNTPLAHYLGVDFFVQNSVSVLDEPYATQFGKKLLTAADLDVMTREWNNVILEIQVVLVARKKPS
jgi:predicted SAM-dependent methyltransferase